MTAHYYLACIDTGDVLDLGKLVWMDEDGNEIPWAMGGWADLATGEWIDGGELWRVVQRFIICHRGKELRLLSEAYLENIDPDARLRYWDERDEILGLDVWPTPDDELDARDVPPDVGERLKTKFTENDL